MGKREFYANGKDIRRRGTQNVYATLTGPEEGSIEQVIGLLNGVSNETDLCFALSQGSRHDVVCHVLGRIQEDLAFSGDNASRVNALLERLEAGTELARSRSEQEAAIA